MRLPDLRSTVTVLALLSASTLAHSANVYSQQPTTTPPASAPSTDAKLPTLPGQTSTTTAAEPPKVDPEEEAAYKAFTDTKPEDDDKRIQLGNAFVAKYPNSKYAAAVYSGLTQNEYDKQDVPKLEEDGDKALALTPDDVSVLVLVGWVIPHAYNPDDPNATKRLDKAEAYEKHALSLLPNLPKPANLTDEQFATIKSAAESQAHSALGLIYFRKQNFEQAVTELKTATTTAKTPDPTDFYVLGVSQKALKSYTDSADSFTKCAAIPGGLQTRCKDQADQVKKLATAAPAK